MNGQILKRVAKIPKCKRVTLTEHLGGYLMYVKLTIRDSHGLDFKDQLCFDTIYDAAIYAHPFVLDGWLVTFHFVGLER